MAIREDDENYSKLLNRFKDEVAYPKQSWLTVYSVEVVASFLCEEVFLMLNNPKSVRTRGSLFYLRLDNLRSSVHRFMPDPLCPECGDPPEDTAEKASIVLKSRPKSSPKSYRVRRLVDQKTQILTDYVDAEAGIVRGLNKDGRSIFPMARAPLGLRGTRATEAGFGRELSYEASELAAVAEALERYSGIQPRGKRTAVRASYNQLGEEALDPTTLGLHSDEQYQSPGYPYVRYHHDLISNWVWGYSFRQNQPILVPEDYAYYGTLYRSRSDRPFVYEVSNGCALGGCLEEAILHGIFEVAERDAFLMTWYARLSAPRVDLSSAEDRSISLMAERIEQVTGYAVRVYNTTLEQGIPCSWAMAVDEQDRPGYPKVLCAAGSHLVPEKALANALLELAPVILQTLPKYRENRARALRMLRDPHSVVTMEDHTLLYGAPEAFGRFGFLYTSLNQQTLDEAFGHKYRESSRADLLQDLNETVSSYLDSGLDVVVVDQTAPEQDAGDFSCVKVIIPGTLSMTFGHYARRTNNLDRLYQVPHKMGYYPRPLTDAEINPHPHPFP